MDLHTSNSDRRKIDQDPWWGRNNKNRYCAKHGKGNTRCAKCNIKGLEEGGATTFCLDCNDEIFWKEMEYALSRS